MKTIALVAKRNHPAAAQLAKAIRQRFSQYTFWAERHVAETLNWPLPESDEGLAQADLMVVLGGDGTLIHGARLLKGNPVPILGINMGSLGFLTEVPQEEALAQLEEVLAGRARVESRMKLSCRLLRNGQVRVEEDVLNDVVINKGALARISDHETYIDGQFVTIYKADGMILSTPTGSTAYSLSANGPIVHPEVDCVVVTPICPHALTQRPLVVPGNKRLRVVLKSESTDVYLTLDGQSGHALETGDVVEVEKSPHLLLLVKNPHRDYFSILRQKLHWGER